ncbi:hypothetical protein KC19_VG316000 [Ceratodon purpureus]|uniref:Uncharacterized protein n=1 Tax=Ceratodon purpureus TaxID=3225 RepID=A0A8T0HW49_CERPU|nr:hypothetical protein KC19_VG316000 [Ceratodon purpureus]
MGQRQNTSSHPKQYAYRNNMPIGAAISTEVSASIGTESLEMSPGPVIDKSPSTGTLHPINIVSEDIISSPAQSLPDPSEDGVTTRRMTAVGAQDTILREPRMKFPLTLTPRITKQLVAAICLVFILHPDHGGNIVGEGRTGGSWKAQSRMMGSLCSEGEQMVQVHKVLIPNVPLVFVETRQPFTLLDHAIVKPSGSKCVR